MESVVQSYLFSSALQHRGDGFHLELGQDGGLDVLAERGLIRIWTDRDDFTFVVGEPQRELFQLFHDLLSALTFRLDALQLQKEKKYD